MTDETNVPAKRGQFVKGHSGNPKGRPKGSRNAISLIQLQIEGELRARMRKDMHAVVAEVVRQALPKTATRKVQDPETKVWKDEEYVVDGDKEMLKLLFGAWVPKARSGDDEAPKERVQIVIGRLDNDKPPINVIEQDRN